MGISPQEGVSVKGFIAEVLVQGKWSRNAQVWPDAVSAESAGFDLLGRWTMAENIRVVEVDEVPNYPTWTEYVDKNGLPPKRVTL